MDAIDALKMVERTLNEHRLAGLDQNPMGFRDLLGSAIHTLERARATDRRRIADLEDFLRGQAEQARRMAGERK